MDSRQQNKEVEYRSKMALHGCYVDWKTTPISETPQAIATDPVKLATFGWWRNVEPRDIRGRQIIPFGRDAMEVKRDVRRHARDGKEEEQQSISPHVKDADPYAELLPEDGDNLWKWVDDLAIKVNCNGSAAPWYQALRSYCHKFDQVTLAREADQAMLSRFLKEICGGQQ
jgi:hypothetical protein